MCIREEAKEMPVQGESKKILLIDDDASLLLTLSDFLKFEGYEVITADSGEKGLKRLAKMVPDLIILDMSMPGMGGVGFLKEISSSDGKPKYPVLVLTARANMAEFFANVDVDGFVAKPCDPDDLLMEVGRIVFLRSGDGKPSGRIKEKHSVLVGEDDTEANANIVSSLESAGYDAEGVFTGPEAVEKAIVQQPDVILIKAVLANMNGDAVARMLQEMPKARTIPIVLYDDSSSQVSEAKYLEPGTGIKKFVRGKATAALVNAVKAVLGDE
jgi:CheY-like chemotaxis protein